MSESPTPWRYPDADRDPVVDQRHGQTVPDPYRWLEDPHGARTLAFVAAQHALSGQYLAGLPARGWFGDALDQLLSAPVAGAPYRRGGCYLRWLRRGDEQQSSVYVAGDLHTLLTAPRRLIDPTEVDPAGHSPLRQVSPSPDGTRVAYGISATSSDWIEWRVRDVATGVDLPDLVTRSKFSGAEWLPDGSGFLYWAFPEHAQASGDDTSVLRAGSVLLHRLGTDAADDEVVHHRPDRPRERVETRITEDGRWLLLSSFEGTARANSLTARRVLPGGRFGPPLVVVPAEPTALYTVAGNDGDLLYLNTDEQASRHRLVAVDLAALATAVEQGAPSTTAWHELVPEQPAMLAGAHRAGAGFLALYLEDASYRLHRLGRDGRFLGEVKLPGLVSVAGWSGHADDDEAFVSVMSFTEPERSYRLDLATGALTELPSVPPTPDGTVAGPGTAGAGPLPAGKHSPGDGQLYGDGPLPGSGPVTRRAGAISRDGTTVPYFLVHRADLSLDRPRPTVLYGYGGFSQPVTPTYQPAWAAWVAAGGIVAVANLRGGGEYGREWYEAGIRERKQNVFDDCIAVGEHLIATGVTSGEQLALHGRSNGGLLVGAVMTQRPDLAAVALPMVGVLDMLRFHTFTIGWAWIPDYGDPDDPDDFPVLHAYSPLHQLREGVAYPATLVLTGDHDDRVVPAHSLKFAAELQRVHAGAGPVLLRVETATGHGQGKPRSAVLAETADMLAFAAHHTGLLPGGG